MGDTASDRLSERLEILVSGVPVLTSAESTSINTEAQIETRKRKAIGKPGATITSDHTGEMVAFNVSATDAAWDLFVNNEMTRIEARNPANITAIHTKRYPKTGRIIVDTFVACSLESAPRATGTDDDATFAVSLVSGQKRITA
jgi:hypothetical protein